MINDYPDPLSSDKTVYETNRFHWTYIQGVIRSYITISLPSVGSQQTSKILAKSSCCLQEGKKYQKKKKSIYTPEIAVLGPLTSGNLRLPEILLAMNPSASCVSDPKYHQFKAGTERLQFRCEHSLGRRYQGLRGPSAKIELEDLEIVHPHEALMKVAPLDIGIILTCMRVWCR